MEAGDKRRGGFGRRACKAELEFLQAITGRARHQGILPSSSSLIWSRIARSEPRAFDIGSPGCDRWRAETQGRGELLHSVLQVRKKNQNFRSFTSYEPVNEQVSNQLSFQRSRRKTTSGNRRNLLFLRPPSSSLLLSNHHLGRTPSLS